MQLAILLVIFLSAIAVFALQWSNQNEEDESTNKDWRWALHKRRILRWFIFKAWQQYIPNLRWLVLLFIGLITYWLVRKYLPNFKITEIAKLNKVSDATVMLALIGAPSAYVIWWFRDANSRQQIENQRKDVNLKDFQRLAEWAAGMHLPENKVTTSEKEIKAKSNTSNEILTSTETNAVPTGTVIHTPSRREGAASLQIAAIYQLQAFLQGEYGRYFQRPAFQLLKSIWLALVSQNLAELEVIMLKERDFANIEELKAFKGTLSQWKSNLKTTMNSTIGEAITVALGAKEGWLLRTHQADLPNAILTGFNSQLAALHQPLELDGLDLRGAQLQGVDLRGAQLQGVDLRNAQLQGADLRGAQLQGADLRDAQLQGADLRGAQLQGADLRDAQLQGADLRGIQLKRADLRLAQLQGADLNNSKIISSHMQGTNLDGANLFDMSLINIDASCANFGNTNMRNVNIQSTYFLEVVFVNADLSGAKLQNVNIEGSFLGGTNLSNLHLSGDIKFLNCSGDINTKIFIQNTPTIVNIFETFNFRTNLRNLGLDLPARLDTQLHANPTEYTFTNQQNQKETRHDVGLLSSFS